MRKILVFFLIIDSFVSCTPEAPKKKTETSNFSTIRDNQGNTYRAVRIGTQTWMMDNISTVRYSDVIIIQPNKILNDSIHTLSPDSSILYRLPLAKNGVSYYPDTLAYYWKYQGGTSQNNFGKLYTWFTINNRNVCPTGWHVPTEYDWEKLITYLGGPDVAGGKMKSTDTTMWEKPNVGATNSSNFSGIGGGYRTEFATFIDQLKFGMYWSATEDPDFKDCAFAYALYAGSIKSFKVSKSKKAALSIRCVSNK
jgi:uncharacterized protein (TIGR02145 family)